MVDRIYISCRSCGVSLYLMLTGLFPFARDSDDECTNVVRMQRMFTRIIQGDYAPLEQVRRPGCASSWRTQCTVAVLLEHDLPASSQPVVCVMPRCRRRGRT